METQKDKHLCPRRRRVAGTGALTILRGTSAVGPENIDVETLAIFTMTPTCFYEGLLPIKIIEYVKTLGITN